MSDPRFPPVTASLLRDLPETFRKWLTPFIMRLTEMFRTMTPAAGWRVIQPMYHGGTTASIDTTQYAPVYTFPPALQTGFGISFVLPSDLAFYVPDEEGNQNPPQLYLQVTWFSKGTSTVTWRAAGEYNYITEGQQSNGNFAYLNTKDITPSGTAKEVQTFEFNVLQNAKFEPNGTIHVFFVRKGHQDTNPDDIYISKIALVYYSDGQNTYERTPNAAGSRYTKRQMFAP